MLMHQKLALDVRGWGSIWECTWVMLPVRRPLGPLEVNWVVMRRTVVMRPLVRQRGTITILAALRRFLPHTSLQG